MKLYLTKKEARKLAGIVAVLEETDTFSFINFSAISAVAGAADKNGSAALEFPDDLVLRLCKVSMAAMEASKNDWVGDKPNVDIANLLTSTFGVGPIMHVIADISEIFGDSPFVDGFKEMFSEEQDTPDAPRHDPTEQTTPGKKGPTLEDLYEWGGIEAIPLGEWDIDAPVYGDTALYGFTVIFFGMVDKDKNIKSINQVWLPSLPNISIEDLTDEELEFLKKPCMYTVTHRAATMAIARRHAMDDFKTSYDRNVRRGMLHFPDTFAYPLKWRAPRKTGEKIWSR